MTPRQLNYFLVIADLRNFTRASSVLHIAQPALSRQIQQLEDDLGVKLFNRIDTGVTLTDAGVLLRERAVGLLDRFEQVRNEISAHASQPRGSIHVGLPPSMFELVTVPLVQRYHQRYPDVKIKITEGISTALHEAVLSGRIDFAVVSSTESLPALEGHLLLREQLYLAGAPSEQQQYVDELAQDLERIATLPLMSTNRPNAMRLIVEDAMAARGLQSNVMLETSSSRLLTELVARGLGWTILPSCAIQSLAKAGSLVAAPVLGLEITWMLVHTRERALSISGQKFRDLLIEIARAEIAARNWLGVTALD
jgi:LysR family nitrogen assimilation transcriptional regulator